MYPPKPKLHGGKVRHALKTVTCPYCHACQEESTHVISTVCHVCSHYFQPGQKPKSPAEGARRRRWWHRKPLPKRLVPCFACGSQHEVSKFAETTLCPTCGAFIELRDIRIHRPLSRMVDTRGTLHITRDGILTNASTLCGRAVIEGSWSGRLYCDGEAILHGKGAFSGRLIAQKIRIGRKADIRLTLPIHTADLEVRGRLEADIYCSGKIRICKNGYLHGDIHARAIVVDKGGSYSGSLRIDAQEAPSPPQDHPHIKKTADPLKVIRKRRDKLRFSSP